MVSETLTDPDSASYMYKSAKCCKTWLDDTMRQHRKAALAKLNQIYSDLRIDACYRLLPVSYAYHKMDGTERLTQEIGFFRIQNENLCQRVAVSGSKNHEEKE